MTSLIKSNKRKRLLLNTSLEINGFKPKTLPNDYSHDQTETVNVMSPKTKLLSIENVDSSIAISDFKLEVPIESNGKLLETER